MRAMMTIICIAATAITLPAEAKCKSTATLIAYLVPLAASNFADARGEVTAKFPDNIGEQYANSPSAKAMCDDFILEHALASGNNPENWQVKFDDAHKGSPNDVGLWAIKTFEPILKRYGFRQKPFYHEETDGSGYSLFWPGPSGTWANFAAYSDPEGKPGFVSYEVKVGHNLQ